MSDEGLTRDRFRRPEILFQELLRKHARGELLERGEHTQFLHRALVIAVDVQGAKLENPDANGKVTHKIDGVGTFDVPARTGPENPPNSIKARVLSDGDDKFTNDEQLRVFWPFFPESISVPIKPGEHVYVVFEDTEQQHGLWVTKVPGHTGVNYSPGKKFYTPLETAPLASKFPDTAAAQGGSQKFDTDGDAAETKSNRLTNLF